MAFFVIVGLFLATLMIMVPSIILNIVQGQVGIVDLFQSIILIPVIAVAGGGLLAGLPVAITGLCMELFRRLPMALFLAATLIISLLLEFAYCQLLHVKEESIYTLLVVTAITTVSLSIVWRQWLTARLGID